MRFILAGRTITLEDLEPALDRAFFDLHAAFLNNAQINMADFERVALDFFNGPGSQASAHDKFFDNFTVIWRWFLDNQRIEEAESLWEMALQPALLWESQHRGKFIHKGPAFYLWGVTALLRGDMDKGYALMHQALEEDARATGKVVPDTPAFYFATLNYTKLDPSLRQWPLALAEFLNNFLVAYCESFRRKLTLEQFRSRFLSNPPRRDAVFLFAHALARLFRLDKVPEYGLTSSFAGQLEINLLFDITLVIDTAIKAKNPDSWQFADHAVFLFKGRPEPLTKKQLQHVGSQFRDDFDGTLNKLLDEEFALPDGRILSSHERDLAITYGLRNHGAHDVSSVPTVRCRFKEIRQSLFNTLFFAVEVLY